MERSGKKKKKVEDSDDQDYKKKVLLDYSTPGVVGNLGSVSEYAKAQKISVGRAKRELEKNLAYTLHKPRRRRGAFQPVLVFDMDEQWVADLIEVQSIAKQNKGYRYLLTVIDVLSKYAWVQSLKKKTGKDVTEAFRRVLTQAEGRKPLKLQTDAGKEFYNGTFQELMKREKIHHFSTHGDAKASVVERFNRTLKSKLYRYFTATNTLRFVDVLPKLSNSIITPIMEALAWLLPKSHLGTCKTYGINCTMDTWTKGRNDVPCLKWEIGYVSTRDSDLLRKAIYRDGRRKCLSYVKWFPLWASRPTR